VAIFPLHEKIKSLKEGGVFSTPQQEWGQYNKGIKAKTMGTKII